MSNKIKVVILDYGIGNLYSLTRAVESFKVDCVISDDLGVILSADRLIIPGVGAFGAGMTGLRLRGLESVIKGYIQTGKPVLGICLGAQLLLSEGREFGKHRGLDIISGKVIKFPKLIGGAKVPHIGWDQIKGTSSDLFKGLPARPYLYFVHSYIMQPKQTDHILATSQYGGQQFCAAIRSGNVYGVQFHPEKSGSVGKQIIKNFLMNHYA